MTLLSLRNLLRNVEYISLKLTKITLGIGWIRYDSVHAMPTLSKIIGMASVAVPGRTQTVLRNLSRCSK